MNKRHITQPPALLAAELADSHLRRALALVEPGPAAAALADALERLSRAKAAMQRVHSARGREATPWHEADIRPCATRMVDAIALADNIEQDWP